MTRIGVISDTHALSDLTRRAVAVFQEMGVERVIHCGDIGSEEVVQILSIFPTDYVFGNCDTSRTRLRNAIVASGGRCHDDFASLEIAGKRVAVYHGQDDSRLDDEARSGDWNLICTGHTHQSCYTELYGTRILNPGALRRRWESPGAAIVDFPKIDVTFFKVDS